jgi:tetratricopeptide (TPR) repeat protein
MIESRRALVAAFAFFAMNATAATSDFSAELDKLWDYAQPAASEQRFRDALAGYPRDSREALETETQLARTQGLQRKFAEADKILDGVLPKLDRVPVRVKVRYFLERGRTRNSSGDRPAATALFHEALKLSDTDTLPGADDYRIDALHMLGIAAPADEQLDWNLKALAASDASSDPGGRRWAASLNNNIGWTYFDRGEYKTALVHWERALALFETRGNVGNIRIAKWTVARGYRALGRLDDAEKIQLALASQRAADGEQSGYVFEELAEITYAKGDKDAAKTWAAKGYNLLRDDPDMSSETERLRRMLNLSQGRAP